MGRGEDTLNKLNLTSVQDQVCFRYKGLENANGEGIYIYILDIYIYVYIYIWIE